MTHNDTIYLDHSASTPLDPTVLKSMMPYFTELYANPSSLHQEGQRVHEAVEMARAVVANCLGASPNEIFFTSGGTESDNLAIRGVALARKAHGKKLIVSPMEHAAVMETVRFLEREGCEVIELGVDHSGQVNPKDLEAAIDPETILVCVLHASNEVGTIQPIAEIAQVCRAKRVYFHVDAVQTAGKLPIDVKALGVDTLAISAHKFYGPRGIGALYIRSGVRVAPQITGGGQEMGRRSGTENVAGIAGLSEALKIATDRIDEDATHETILRDQVIREVLRRIPDTLLTGHPNNRLPGHASFCFHGVEGEAVIIALDQAGIATSAGSACSSGSLDPPHSLQAMGIPSDYARGSLRISMGRSTTAKQIARLLDVLPGIVARVRSMARPG